MIVQFFPSEKRKAYKPPVTSTHQHYGTQKSAAEKAEALNITVAEYWKRKNMVIDEVKKLKYRVGDKVVPVLKKDADKHGEMEVSGICFDYDHYGEVDWNDPPYIISVHKAQGGYTINCTIGWVKPVPQNCEGVC